MKILYISSLSSEKLINEIYQKTECDPGFAVQKFNRLIVKGFIKNENSTEVYSNPPVNAIAGKSRVAIPKEEENGIVFQYANHFNIPLLKDLEVIWRTFTKVLRWGLIDKKNKVVVCDALAISSNIGAMFACKILGLRIVGILTDMPGLMVTTSNSKNKTKYTCLGRIYAAANKSFIHSYSHYVFLTKQMNNVINIHNRPYIVMEALCDNLLTDEQLQLAIKKEPKVLMYAGVLHEKYGLKLLVDGFRRIQRDDIELDIYGSGPYVENLKKIATEDSRICYKGVVSNKEVVKAELEATLLINPRPTTEEFTKYSFPSKNMEYMASGTPLLTTRLPGMPADYYEYIYTIDEETTEGYKTAIEKTLSNSSMDLKEKGKKARYFVTINKNNKIQTRRIVELLNK